MEHSIRLLRFLDIARAGIHPGQLSVRRYPVLDLSQHTFQGRFALFGFPKCSTHLPMLPGRVKGINGHGLLDAIKRSFCLPEIEHWNCFGDEVVRCVGGELDGLLKACQAFFALAGQHVVPRQGLDAG